MNDLETVMASSILWRYRPYLPERKEELAEIVSGKIYCPAAKNFNDPFDLNPSIQHSDVSIEEQIRRVLRMADSHAATHPELERALEAARRGYMNTDDFHARLEGSLRQDLFETPILCFFPSWSSVPMWAHYGGSAAGYAVGIHIDEPWEGKYYPLPVIYSDERPIIDLSEDTVEDREARIRHLQRAFLTKSSVWEQEQEQRVIFFDRAEGHYEIDPGYVVEVCLGPQASDALLETAIDASRAREDGLRISKIRLSDRSFSLEKEQLRLD